MVGRTCTGDQKIWAAVSDKAKNQASNCVNGDFFTWKSMWKVLREVVHVEFVGFEESRSSILWG